MTIQVGIGDESERHTRRAVLEQTIASGMPQVRADLKRLVRIPSVWADPEYVADTEECAAAVAELARELGPETLHVLRSEGGGPAVIARWPAPPGQPTILLYAHHDVQPSGGDERWTSDPFEPTERDGRLYGRGTADDKAGVMTHLAAIRAFGGEPPVGVTLFVEGEEESGSPTLPDLLHEHHDLLAADIIVIADSANPAVDVPAVTTTLRGAVDVVVEVAMLTGPTHSGFHGGPVGDALTALCHMLSSLHDKDGEVAVAGLRSTIGADASVLTTSEKEFRSEAGLLEGTELLGSGTLPERLWHKPAIAVLGIDAPEVEGSANVLVPQARARVGMRIAPDEEAIAARDRLADHLRGHVPWGAHVSVSPGVGVGEPVRLNTKGEVYRIAKRVLADAYGNPTVETGIGASIPFITEFSRAFPDATVLVTGVGDPASRWHGIDESLSLEMFHKGILAEVFMLDELDTTSSHL